MPILSAPERRFLRQVANLAYCNPFLPERVSYEKAALGPGFVPGEPVWSASVAAPDLPRTNVLRIHARLEPMLTGVRKRVANATSVDPEDLEIYEEAVQHLLYLRYYPQFLKVNGKWKFYHDFVTDCQWFFDIPGKSFETLQQAPHVFACLRQIQRAFDHIFDNIIGNSLPAARLRASVWQSIFTHDMRRYRRMKRSCVLVLLLIGAVGVCFCQSQPAAQTISTDPNDWPMYNHDSLGTRFNSAETVLSSKNVGQLGIKWTYFTAGDVYATPAVVDNTVYAGDSKGVFYALTSAGHLLWTFKASAGITPAHLSQTAWCFSATKEEIPTASTETPAKKSGRSVRTLIHLPLFGVRPGGPMEVWLWGLLQTRRTPRKRPAQPIHAARSAVPPCGWIRTPAILSGKLA